MSGKDSAVGWCEIEISNGDVIFVPSGEFDRMETALDSRKGGWWKLVDVYGDEQKYRYRDVVRLSNRSPAGIKLRAQEEQEDRLLNGEE